MVLREGRSAGDLPVGLMHFGGDSHGLVKSDSRFLSVLEELLSEGRFIGLVTQLDGFDSMLVRVVGRMSDMTDAGVERELGRGAGKHRWSVGGHELHIANSIVLSKTQEATSRELTSVEIFLASFFVAAPRVSKDDGYYIDGKFFPSLGADRRGERSSYAHEYCHDFSIAFQHPADILAIACRVKERVTDPAYESVAISGGLNEVKRNMLALEIKKRHEQNLNYLRTGRD